jgi:hypothetical protein
MLDAAHVVCRDCGTRWTVSYQPGKTTPRTQTQCKNRECDAGWIDLPMFWNEADADRAAEEFAREKVAVMREP